MIVAARANAGETAVYVSVKELIQEIGKFESRASKELTLEFLSAWGGVIQEAALDRVEEDEEFSDSIEAGCAKVRLNASLAPEDVTPDAMMKAISLELNLNLDDTKSLAQALEKSFSCIIHDGAIRLEAFGRITRRGPSSYLLVLAADFFNPVIAMPPREDY